MQTKNESQLFISDELEDIIDLNSLTSDDPESFCFALGDKEFPVLSYTESKKKYKLTINVEEKALQKLILKQIDNAFLVFNDHKIKEFKSQQDLIKIKVEKKLKNIYNIKLVFSKEKENGF